MAERVRGVLWDFGHTLVDWDPARLSRKLLADEHAVESFLGGVCTMRWHLEHDRGMPMAENRAALTERFPEHAALIEAWDTRWDEMFDGWVEGMQAIVETLEAQSIPQFGLTNLPAEKWPHVRANYPALSRFADVIVSGEEGLVKPDAEIYHRTIARLPFAPSEVLFIDDRADNIAAARNVGFAGHVFTDAETTRAALREHGLPV